MNLAFIGDGSEIEDLARSVEDAASVVFVLAFSGLFAPYWCDDSRGVVAGLTRLANKDRVVRAAEATATRPANLVDAMLGDSGLSQLGELGADGGRAKNDLLMQFQTDILGSPVGAPSGAEMTPSETAYATGLVTGFWSGIDELRASSVMPLGASDGHGRTGQSVCRIGAAGSNGHRLGQEPIIGAVPPTCRSAQSHDALGGSRRSPTCGSDRPRTFDRQVRHSSDPPSLGQALVGVLVEAPRTKLVGDDG